MARKSSTAPVGGDGAARPRGRPKLEIDQDAVADAVADLFTEGGYDAVSIINTADKLNISRATLYRTVPTKEDLLGILFDRSTAALTADAQAAIRATDDPREQLAALIDLHANAAVQMRAYMPVFFGASHLPSEVVTRWHRWSRKYEAIWVTAIEANVREGILHVDNAKVAARLVLGMLIWVSRWYRPRGVITVAEIADVAKNLLGLVEKPAPRKAAPTGTSRRAAKRV